MPISSVCELYFPVCLSLPVTSVTLCSCVIKSIVYNNPKCADVSHASMGGCCTCEEYHPCNLYLDDFLDKKARSYTIDGVRTRQVEYYGGGTKSSEVHYSQDLCTSCNQPIGGHRRRPLPVSATNP